MSRERRTRTVITFYPGHAVHPDHDALGEATKRAVDGLEAGERPLLLAVAVGSPDALEQLGPPDRYVDIRGVADRKAGALQAHRSQQQLMFEQLQSGQPDAAERTKAFRPDSFAVE